MGESLFLMLSFSFLYLFLTSSCGLMLSIPPVWRRNSFMQNLTQFCLFCLFTVSAVSAQVDTGTISGTIRDSQGAAIASATITFVDVNTNATTKTQSDGSGDYASPPLRPAEYKMIAEAQGFKTETRSTISLKVQDRL